MGLHCGIATKHTMIAQNPNVAKRTNRALLNFRYGILISESGAILIC